MSEPPTRYAKGGVIAGRGGPVCDRQHHWDQPERVMGSDLKLWPYLVRVCTICGAVIRYDQEPA